MQAEQLIEGKLLELNDLWLMLRGIVEKNVYRCKWFNICEKIGIITRGRLATSVDFVHCHVALWKLDWTAWMSEEKNDFFTFHAKKKSERCVATATNCRSASKKEEKFTNRAPIFNLSANIFYLYEKKARQDHSRASLIARGPISTFQQTFITGRWMEEIRACIFFLLRCITCTVRRRRREKSRIKAKRNN